MYKGKLKIKCKCKFCSALKKQTNKDNLYHECAFYFDFNIDSLEWQLQVEIGKVSELYPMPMNGGGTAFLVEESKADKVTTASPDRVAKITGSEWQYITCAAADTAQ